MTLKIRFQTINEMIAYLVIVKRLFLIAIFSFFGVTLSAQVLKLGEAVFPNTTGLVLSTQIDYQYFVHGQYHICTYAGLGIRYCVVLNEETGVSIDQNFVPRTRYNFGEDAIYFGQQTFGNSTNFGYARLSSEGTFIPIPMLPSEPKAFANDKGYAVTNDHLFEISLLPFGINVLHNFTPPIDASETELYVSGDTVYVAQMDGYGIFAIEDSVWSEPYSDYFGNFDLSRLPKTGIDGRYLYADAITADGVHELGRGGGPRQIPVLNGVPDFAFSNAFLGMTDHDRTMGVNVENSENKTWINLLSRIGERWDQQDHLVEIDRSQDNPGLNVVKTFRRAKRECFARSIIASLENEGVVVLGLFGEEGYEPYGFTDQGFSNLKDLIPGKAGSVDYLIDGSGIQDGQGGLFARAYGKLWFSASAPGFGREIFSSDGSPEGTRILTDIEPGLGSLRRVRFDVQNGKLYAFVQLQNYRTEIYRIGPNMPPLPNAMESDVVWEAFDAPLPETALYEGGFRGVQVNPSADGALLQLLDGIPPGRATADSLIPDEYPFYQNALSIDRIFRLDKIDPSTGERLWRRPFLLREGSNESVFKMLGGSDNKTYVLSIGPSVYKDQENDIAIPLEQGIGHNNAIQITTFGSNGAFENIIRVGYELQLHDILYFGEAADGDFIAAAVSIFSGRSLHLLKFSKNGEIKHALDTGLNGFSDLRVWKDENQLIWVSSHPKSQSCENCQVEFQGYDEHLAPFDKRSFSYNGRISKPNIHLRPNGERWFTGAFDTEIIFDFPGARKIIDVENPGQLTPFIVRELILPHFFIAYELLDVDLNGWSTSFVVDGNVFLSYAEKAQVDVPPSSENIYGTFQAPQIFELDHHFVQLDGAGFPYDSYTHKVFSTKNYPDIEIEQGFLDNGLWYQSVFGMKGRTHCLWLTPEPEYIHNYHSGVQVAAMPWPFSPVGIPELTSVEDEGSFIHIFPNPSSTDGFFIIPKNGNTIPYNGLYVHDMQGRLVYQSELISAFNVQRIQIPPNLKAGVYNVVFNGQGAQESHRLVLAR